MSQSAESFLWEIFRNYQIWRFPMQKCQMYLKLVQILNCFFDQQWLWSSENCQYNWVTKFVKIYHIDIYQGPAQVPRYPSKFWKFEYRWVQGKLNENVPLETNKYQAHLDEWKVGLSVYSNLNLCSLERDKRVFKTRSQKPHEVTF